MTDVSTICAVVIFRVKRVDDVIKSGLLNVIGLFSRDVIGWKTRVEFVNSHWSVSIRLLFVGLFVGLFTSLMSRL